jgi:hypothetical protein
VASNKSSDPWLLEWSVKHVDIPKDILDLNLLTLSRLQNASGALRLLSLAEGPSSRAIVESISVDQAVLLERRGVPLGAGDRVDVQDVHGVNLLKRAVLRLNHEEIDNEEEDNERDSEDQTVEVVDLVGDHRGEEGDKEVEQPVGSSLRSR